jgi:hypothetical protein
MNRGTSWCLVPIEIKRAGDKYVATVSPPHGQATPWMSREPMTAQELIDKLQDLGCHTTDIGDAMFEADPLWLNRLGEKR